MKIALLSDIHGNADALQAVLDAAAAAGAERLIVAGDFVGYYYEPDRVLALLDQWSWIGVRGNHEMMLGVWCSGEGRDLISERYGSGIQKAAERLSRGAIARLLMLPDELSSTFDGRAVFVCHGAPGAPDRYIYPDADATAREMLNVPGADLVVFGHTHYPVLWSSDSRQIVNPGSVGQPRNRVPGAHWALWDTSDNSVRPQVTPYDTVRLVEACQRIDPHLPYLADVLRRS